MAEKPNEKDTETGAPVVTQEELLKSIQEVEGKVKDEEPAPEPRVEVEDLSKSTAETVTENASEDLKKALSDSPALREIVKLVGFHVDNSLEALQKSVAKTAETQLAIAGSLQTLNKSIGSFGEKLDQFGEKPAAGPKSTQSTSTEPLKKNTDGGNEQAVQLTPSQVSEGLQDLMKSMEAGSPEAQAWASKIATFESTKTLDQPTLTKVARHLGVMKAA